MKRFVVALIIAAGGLAAAAFAIPKNAATVNGTAISQDQLQSDITAIANSPDYQCYLNAQAYLESGGQQITAPVVGAGQSTGTSHPTSTTAFTSPYVATKINQVMVTNLAAGQGLTVTSAEVTSAQKEFEQQITATMAQAAQHTQSPSITCGSVVPLTGKEVLATMPTWFVQQTATSNATAGVLENSLSGANTTAGLMKYFNAHRAMFDTACFSDAEYSSQAAAQAAAKQVAAGTPFAQVAAAAAAGSGPQGCQNLYGIANQLSSVINLNTLPVNTVSPPISLGGTYLLLQMTSRTPTSFAKAKASVHEALSQVGGSEAGRLLSAAETHASITVDPRYGTWKPPVAAVVVPTTPPVADVCNPSANLPTTAASGATTPTGCLSSSSTGSSG